MLWNEWRDLKCLQKPAIVNWWRLIPRHCVHVQAVKQVNEKVVDDIMKIKVRWESGGQVKEPEKWRQCVQQTKEGMIYGIDAVADPRRGDRPLETVWDGILSATGAQNTTYKRANNVFERSKKRNPWRRR